MLVVTITAFGPSLGITVVPFLSKSLYDRFMTFLVSLGVGTLSGSTLYVLIPGVSIKLKLIIFINFNFFPQKIRNLEKMNDWYVFHRLRTPNFCLQRYCILQTIGYCSLKLPTPAFSTFQALGLDSLEEDTYYIRKSSILLFALYLFFSVDRILAYIVHFRKV